MKMHLGKWDTAVRTIRTAAFLPPAGSALCYGILLGVALHTACSKQR